MVCEQVVDVTWLLHRAGYLQGQAACVTQNTGTLQRPGGDTSSAFQLCGGRGTHGSAYKGQTPHATQQQRDLHGAGEASGGFQAAVVARKRMPGSLHL